MINRNRLNTIQFLKKRQHILAVRNWNIYLEGLIKSFYPDFKKEDVVNSTTYRVSKLIGLSKVYLIKKRYFFFLLSILNY